MLSWRTFCGGVEMALSFRSLKYEPLARKVLGQMVSCPLLARSRHFGVGNLITAFGPKADTRDQQFVGPGLGQKSLCTRC